MTVRLLILFLLCDLTISYNYGQITDTTKTSCQFTVIQQCSYNSRIDPGVYIIETNSDLRDYWALAFGSSIPIPNVYFNSSIVIAINQSFGTGGYTFTIDSIYDTKDKMIINIIVNEPKGTTTMAIEHRCIIFTTKKTNKKIVLSIWGRTRLNIYNSGI